jgi:[ribosomal protein S18]-alanine N-acetyltransferase
MMREIGRSGMTVRDAGVEDCEVLAEMHGEAFRRGWSGAEFEALLVQPGVHALIADWRTALGRRRPAGFILVRIAADEAEVLSIAVVPDCRRRGVGRRLLEEALRRLYRERVASLHLEVEDGNAAALALYRRMDFAETGRRPNYYGQGTAPPRGALVMRRQLR